MRSRSNALPKYVQIAEMLIRDIASGRLEDGVRLPPERQMAAELGIAVGTLRKSLADLSEKGLLQSVHGSGNYIRYRPEAAGVYAFFRLERIQGGGLPTAEVLDVTRVAAADVPGVFGGDTTAHRIRRLRRLSGEPIALEEIWLHGRWAETISREDLSESLYFFYRRKLGLWIASAEDRVGVATVPDWSVPEFPMAANSLSGYVERRGCTPDGRMAEFSLTWFNANKALYVNRLR
jgi:GntR family transcriptional regulator